MKRIIVISGGSDGLGKSLAQALVTDNTVIILAPNEEKTKAVASSIDCEYEVCDISDSASVAHAVSAIIAKYSRIDILINNAAIWIEGPLEENTPEAIKRVIDVNTT